LIGCCSTATDLTIYLLFTSLGLLAASPAKASSYLLAMVFGFFGNKLWAFQSQRRSLDEPLAFFALYGTTLLVNVGLNALGLAILGHTLPARLMAFVAATGVTTVLNFLGLRFVAFRRGIEEQSLAAASSRATEAG
jgi:putative flippase GtrA